jgi:peptide/nickel transport system permease protein
MLLTRNSMLETLREDYIMAARAKGLPEKVVRDKHAARNAMLPVATAFVWRWRLSWMAA